MVALLSLLISLFSAGFTVQRSQQEDDRQLRDQLTSILRRVTVLNAGSGSSQQRLVERTSLVAQAREILPQLDYVPTIYLRALAEAMESTYYYGDALTFVDRALEQAVDEEDLFEQVYGRRLKARIYAYRLRDWPRARTQYGKIVELAEDEPGPDGLALIELQIGTYSDWLRGEAAFGECGRTSAILRAGEGLLQDRPYLRASWGAMLEDARGDAETRCAHESASDVVQPTPPPDPRPRSRPRR